MRAIHVIVSLVVAAIAVAALAGGCGVSVQSAPVPLTAASMPPVLVPTVTQRPGPGTPSTPASTPTSTPASIPTPTTSPTPPVLSPGPTTPNSVGLGS
jgi:hypothetical protein